MKSLMRNYIRPKKDAFVPGFVNTVGVNPFLGSRIRSWI